MSLTRQLWLAVALVMALAFGGSFVLSTAAARQYFEQQLFVKNVDNATSLALSMSQMKKDTVTLELLLSAQFDAGHYRLIRLVDPAGSLIMERRDDAPVLGVPGWFRSIVALEVAPGLAQVQDGWNQYGSLSVQSHDQYAYVGLWRATWQLLAWFALTALVVGLLGSVLLRLILRPLGQVVEQAEAMGRRQFRSEPEPTTPEFRQLVRSMNGLSDRVQQMLRDESQRVEHLRRQVQLDLLTGLSNRDSFIASLADALGGDEHGSGGVLVMLRLAGLAELNRSIGREAVDELLRRVAGHLARAATGHSNSWTTARLGSADFAVIAAGETEALAIAVRLAAQAKLALDRPDSAQDAVIWCGCSDYQRGESRSAVLARVDAALVQAERAGSVVVLAEAPLIQPILPTDLASWRPALESALDAHGVQLGRFPVTAVDGALLHEEAPLRLHLAGSWIPAARFIAWAARLGLMPRLDRRVIEAALSYLAQGHSALSVNVSPESLCDPDFVAFVQSRVMAQPALAPRLCLEVPEYGALRHLDEFRRFCHAVKPLGCPLGLKQAGTRFSRIWELHDLGLDYLKLEGSLVQGLGGNAEQSIFLRSLCTVAHAMGLKILATGVKETQELALLADLGMDGYTGPAVKPRPG